MNQFLKALMFLLIASFSFSVVAQEPPQKNTGFESVETLFAAYADAVRGDDWNTVFHMGTERHQRAENIDLVYIVLLAAAEREDLRASIERIGIPWAELQPILQSIENLDANDPEDFEEFQFRVGKKIDDLVAANVADKGRLFVDLHSFAQPPIKREFKVSYTVQGEDTASGEMSWKTGPAERPDTISEEVTFRRIDGLWYFGLNDEGIALYEKIDAQEDPPQKNTGFESVESLFAAYAAAASSGDWNTAFHMGTERRQRMENFEFVFMSLPAAAEKEDLRAVIERSGVPWTELQPILQSWKNADPNDAGFGEHELRLVKKIDDLIVANVADKGRLFADLRSYGQPPPRRDIKLSELVQGEDTASGVMSAVFGPDGRSTESEEVTFRRIDGLWYFGLDDEAIAQFEKWDAQEQD